MDRAHDVALISRCRAGDPAAVESLVRRHQTPVYRLALSILDDPAEADEAAQDAFVAAIRRLDTFRGDSAFSTWLFAIAINVCRGRLRKRRTREKLTQALRARMESEDEAGEHAEQTAADRARRAALWQAVRDLDDKLREVVVLRYYHELRLADIAQVVGVSERTVRSRLVAAYEAMRRMLQEEHELT